VEEFEEGTLDAVMAQTGTEKKKKSFLVRPMILMMCFDRWLADWLVLIL
jgi:hypothetical protein